jgi:stage III sporulation protein AE
MMRSSKKVKQSVAGKSPKRNRNEAIKQTLMLFIVLLCFFGRTASASELITDNAKDALAPYNLERYDEEIARQLGGMPLKFSELIEGALFGDLDMLGLVRGIAGIAFSEVVSSTATIRMVIAISILGALLKSFSLGFSDKSVSEIGFYVIYIALTTLLISSFIEASMIASSAISLMTGLMQILLPLIMALLIASGRYAISFVFNPSAIFVIQIAAFIIDRVVLKVILLTAILQMINFLTPSGQLDKMTKLAYNIISKGLKGIALIFMAVTTIETIAAPLATGVIGKTAKALIAAVPAVGGAFKGAVDSVFIWGSAVKNAAAIATIISILFLTMIPVIKLLIIALLYKLTAALIEPFADERAVSLIDAAGSYILLFVMAVTCVSVMFITLLMMVIAGAIG